MKISTGFFFFWIPMNKYVIDHKKMLNRYVWTGDVGTQAAVCKGHNKVVFPKVGGESP